LTSEDGKQFAAELTRFNFAKVLQLSSTEGFDYPYCIVFPQAMMGMHELITHDHIAGQPDRISDVRATMSQIGKAVGHSRRLEATEHYEGIRYYVG
jgi:hypothetical protein